MLAKTYFNSLCDQIEKLPKINLKNYGSPLDAGDWMSTMGRQFGSLWCLICYKYTRKTWSKAVRWSYKKSLYKYLDSESTVCKLNYSMTLRQCHTKEFISRMNIGPSIIQMLNNILLRRLQKRKFNIYLSLSSRTQAMLWVWIIKKVLRGSLSFWGVLQYSTTQSVKIMLKAQPMSVKILPCVLQLSTC